MDKNNLVNLRNHLKYVPFNLAIVKQTGTIVELVSYPYEEPGKGVYIKARTTIGDPTSMVDFRVENLCTPEEAARRLSETAKRMSECSSSKEPVFIRMTGDGLQHYATIIKAWLDYSIRNMNTNQENVDWSGE